MTYRIYFNRIEDAPQVWSVDEGSCESEINVQGWIWGGRGVRPGVNLDAQYPEPKAWFEIDDAEMHIQHGIAIFSRP